MITVAIVGILAAIASNYVAYITRSKIVDGVTKMGDFRRRWKNISWTTGGTRRLRGAVCGVVPVVAPEDKFTITCTTLPISPTSSGQTASPRREWRGFRYTVDQTNTKTTVALLAGWTITAVAGSCARTARADGPPDASWLHAGRAARRDRDCSAAHCDGRVPNTLLDC
jgi:Tfp pilus assembly major pilin PilA